uniref:proteasome endopeptidase complex n=1 Tax=Pundamilia nyererei TaxID=303518 RepID=A0A3B4GG30_9CICH
MAAAPVMMPYFGQQISSKSDLVPDWTRQEVSTGTTIMAVEYDGGVVIGADSRTTTGAGNTPLTSPVCVCLFQTQVRPILTCVFGPAHSIELDEPPLVETAANLFRASCYRYREELTAGILVAGWDKRKGGQVYSVPIGGMLVRQPVSVGGSGSTYIYGFMDANYKPGMNKEQCMEITAAALSLAMERDGSSGGVVRLASISEEGVERRVILGNQLPKFSTH